ncbi:MAG: hypothetical protein LBM07_00955 [Culturomica sp.]|jgi:hypothetical protein|nr:hypothetical protein [Culturomica sp.]
MFGGVAVGSHSLARATLLASRQAGWLLYCASYGSHIRHYSTSGEIPVVPGEIPVASGKIPVAPGEFAGDTK